MKTNSRNMFISFSVFLGVSLGLIEAATLEKNIGYCAAPTVADNFDIQWAHDHSHEGWHISLGNLAARKHIFEILQARNWTEDSVSDYSDMCAKFTIDIDNTDGNFRGEYFGYGNKSADWNCNFDIENNDQFQCNYINNPDITYVQHGQAYLSYFDGQHNHNFFVAVLCFDNGDSGWFAASLTKTISSEERKEINNHLRSIGFDPANTVELHSVNC